MIKYAMLFLFLFCITGSSVFAQTDSIKQDAQSQDSSKNSINLVLKSEDAKSDNESLQDSVQDAKLTKKQLRAKRRKERKKYNDMTVSAHKSMLIGSSDHEHGFTRKKQGSTKGPLQPQTMCPVMGGPIDKRFYMDYNGYRIYVCCEGCIYQLKRTPKLYIKTLKRYGEKPIKIPKDEKEQKTETKEKE